VRDGLNKRALRRMAVLDPVKVVIDNYPEGQVEYAEAMNNPEYPSAGTRQVPFSREVYIGARIHGGAGKEVFPHGAGTGSAAARRVPLHLHARRQDAAGAVTEIHGTYDPRPKAATPPTAARSRGRFTGCRRRMRYRLRCGCMTGSSQCPIRWRTARSDFTEFLNPESLKSVTAWGEPALAQAQPGERFQFERIGYFCADTEDSQPASRFLTVRRPLRILGPKRRKNN
jgi:glutaminyl-tRNA synthetase